MIDKLTIDELNAKKDVVELSGDLTKEISIEVLKSSLASTNAQRIKLNQISVKLQKDLAYSLLRNESIQTVDIPYNIEIISFYLWISKLSHRSSKLTLHSDITPVLKETLEEHHLLQTFKNEIENRTNTIGESNVTVKLSQSYNIQDWSSEKTNNYTFIKNHNNYSIQEQITISSYARSCHFISCNLVNKNLVSFSINETHNDLKDLKVPFRLPEYRLIRTLLYHTLGGGSSAGAEELTKQYFNGPAPESLTQETHQSLFITKELLINDNTIGQIENLLTNQGIDLLDNPTVETHYLTQYTWLRDYLICRGDGKYIIGDMISPYNIQCAIAISTLNPDNPFKSKLSDNRFLGYGAQDNKLPLIQLLKDQGYVIECTNIIIEGGNTITIRMPGNSRVIVGENTKIATAVHLESKKMIHKMKKSGPNKNKLSLFYQKLDEAKLCVTSEHLRYAKHQIIKTLNIEKNQIVFVPNMKLGFHIDMFMMAVDEKILLNSFREGIRKLEKYANNVTSSEEKFIVEAMIKAAQEYQNEFGHIIDKIKNKLEKNGIEVIEVPGIFYLKDYEEDKMIVIANYMNAHYGKGKSGSFYSTPTSQYPFTNQLFEDAVKQHCAIDTFLFAGTPSLTNHLYNNLKGAYRCCSTQRSFFSQVDTLVANEEKSGLDIKFSKK